MTGPVPVTVATATKGSIGVYQDAIGTVTPVYTATITAQASGVLTKVDYREGQFVHKGDALIEIDPRPYQATLLQAEGTLERDQSILAQAQMDLDRYRTAWARNAINKQLLDDQEKIVLQDQGTVKNDQGTVDYDQVQLGYCNITAPISGQVGLRLVDPGNVVQAGGTGALVVITQMQPTTVIFTLAEDSLGPVEGRMHKMHSLPVEAWDRNSANKLADGKLLTINNQIDTTTGTVKLRATFDNRKSTLFPNQFVNARLLQQEKTGVTLLPSAVLTMATVTRLPGTSSAGPIPWSTRAASSTPTAGARPLASEAAMNSSTPVMKTRRRPSRSAARPPSSRKPANVSA